MMRGVRKLYQEKTGRRGTEPGCTVQMMVKEVYGRSMNTSACWAFLLTQRGLDPQAWTKLSVAERTRVVEARSFYASDAWRSLRYRILSESDGRCCLCGRQASNGVEIHVDHIKPRSLRPDLALEPTNLQVLCEDCNLGKSNRDDTDWRQPAATKVPVA